MPATSTWWCRELTQQATASTLSWWMDCPAAHLRRPRLQARRRRQLVQAQILQHEPPCLPPRARPPGLQSGRASPPCLLLSNLLQGSKTPSTTQMPAKKPQRRMPQVCCNPTRLLRNSCLTTARASGRSDIRAPHQVLRCPQSGSTASRHQRAHSPLRSTRSRLYGLTRRTYSANSLVSWSTSMLMAITTLPTRCL